MPGVNAAAMGFCCVASKEGQGMSLRGYKKKTRPANWTTVPGAVGPKVLKVNWLQRSVPRRRAHLCSVPIKRIVKKNVARKRIRQVSLAQSRKNAEYLREVRVWIVGKTCQAWCSDIGVNRSAEECHHIRGRIGKLLLDNKWWLPVCSQCHRKMRESQFQSDAQARGWLAKSGEWGKQY